MRTLLVGCFVAVSSPALAEDVVLNAPEPLVATGVFDYILPRFKLKTQVKVELGEGADLALVPTDTGGVFAWEGQAFALEPASPEGDAGRFAAWLRSEVGLRTVTSYQVDGANPFTPAVAVAAIPVEVEVDGDAAAGERLAHLHCGRCHVISEKNRMGGIGSTPSFGAMKNFVDWQSKFAAFYALNPHPAFTQIEGLTEPFDPAFPPNIAPVEMSFEDYEAILAYVQGLPVKDLGGAVVSK